MNICSVLAFVRSLARSAAPFYVWFLLSASGERHIESLAYGARQKAFEKKEHPRQIWATADAAAIFFSFFGGKEQAYSLFKEKKPTPDTMSDDLGVFLDNGNGGDGGRLNFVYLRVWVWQLSALNFNERKNSLLMPAGSRMEDVRLFRLCDRVTSLEQGLSAVLYMMSQSECSTWLW